jgi:hypothetical protein
LVQIYRVPWLQEYVDASNLNICTNKKLKIYQKVENESSSKAETRFQTTDPKEGEKFRHGSRRALLVDKVLRQSQSESNTSGKFSLNKKKFKL